MIINAIHTKKVGKSSQANETVIRKEDETNSIKVLTKKRITIKKYTKQKNQQKENGENDIEILIQERYERT